MACSQPRHGCSVLESGANFPQRRFYRPSGEYRQSIYGYCIHLGTLGAGRIGGRRPDIGHHGLAGPTYPGEGRAARPEKSQREDLYRDFIVAASKAYGDAIVSNEPQIQELVALYAMISRMRVMSSPPTVASADKIMRATIDTYFAPNKTIRELHELIKSGSAIDPLKEFSEIAREELRAFASL